MKVIKTKCNVINIAPVKEVVSFYSITEAKPLISDYSTTLDEFCHKLKLQFLLDKKLSISDFLICETIEFVLDWDPAEHLLNDIRRLMEKAFQGLSRRIIVKSMHKGNSIIIICGAPTHLMNALQLRARDNLTVLQEKFALMRLKIGHCTVYDRTIRNKELKSVAEGIKLCEGELEKLNLYHNDKKGLLDDQESQLIPLKEKQEFINSSKQASGSKTKVKEMEREKAANTKKRMLLGETEHLQSTLRIRISRKEVLQDNKKKIGELQESISSISVKLLEMQTSYNKKIKSTQTLLSPNGSICEAQVDYSDPVISFKKGELLQLSTNGHEVQSLETGQKSAVPMIYIGYSRVELLYLFQFAVIKEGLSLLPALLDDDEKAEYFILKIAKDPTLLQSLRELITKDKLFVASYNFEAQTSNNLTLKKGEVLEVVTYYEDSDWWYMHSLHTDNKGYVPINYITPIEGEYSPMKYIYYHTVSRAEAEKRLSQADTQAGTFLIRDSESNPGQHYSLSLNGGEVTIRHYRISIENNKYYIHPRVKFDSLNDLVHHYMMKADGLICSLTVPIPKQRNIPIAMNKEWELNKSHIKFSDISVGRFGETWVGFCKGKGPVMIKTNIATDITQETFLDKAIILVKLHHKNIISLYGVCTESYPFYIVTEPINRNLKGYLTKNNPTPAELVDIAIQVTDGMMYLAEQDYIHCDLRAENILLGYTNTVKVANFHLAQHLNGNKYWTVEKGTDLAIRWTAPEGYTLKRLSIKSDVWSFGILLWELGTKRKEPYPGMTNGTVKEAVSKGYHMPIPRDCPKPFKQLMINCWKYKDDERPSFKNVFDVLIKYS
ncbi:PREDICTED: tyrosine-protein kinase STK-like [Amphimedon queenslandica]|uniref:Tyrosine-protein kinase n=1 Tax=Amphimedon queenslandica TaxID=400682 RepID=A0A1X7T014_AMPQE|nr:PREDICTED: tyrosine-protein kinase STK-like [Amphimedon queenslandica]|eukprot:XP_019862004.1 PREDICTED: tyrosine-protein kinase STK-like [Amphimedon queenslandica]